MSWGCLSCRLVFSRGRQLERSAASASDRPKDSNWLQIALTPGQPAHVPLEKYSCPAPLTVDWNSELRLSATTGQDGLAKGNNLGESRKRIERDPTVKITSVGQEMPESFRRAPTSTPIRSTAYSP